MTVSECCLIKLLLCILFEKYIYILALEMASPGNQHCANYIGTLSFPIAVVITSADDVFWHKCVEYYAILFILALLLSETICT